MQVQFLTVALGLAAAIVWGGGDFCGGQATRRASVFSVLIVAEISGLIMLIGLAIAQGEPLPSLLTLKWSLAAGLTGAIGLAALYQALSIGQAGVVAPVSAVLAAAIPALYGALTEGLPDALHLIGFALALVAVWMVAQSGEAKEGLRGLGLAFVAGCGFGFFFILIHYASTTTTFGPLAIARATAIPLVLGTAIYRRATWKPTRAMLPIALLCGLLDAGGNALFVLAAQTGRLDVAAILSSLYPASTVILAWALLGERTTWVQKTGIIAALGAIALIAS